MLGFGLRPLAKCSDAQAQAESETEVMPASDSEKERAQGCAVRLRLRRKRRIQGSTFCLHKIGLNSGVPHLRVTTHWVSVCPAVVKKWNPGRMSTFPEFRT